MLPAVQEDGAQPARDDLGGVERPALGFDLTADPADRDARRVVQSEVQRAPHRCAHGVRGVANRSAPRHRATASRAALVACRT